MSSTLNFIEPQKSRINKRWHENINNEMRKHLVKKIIQTIFPTHDHNIYSDPRLSNLVKYATKTECEMYEQAQDQEEYFHLLAVRIYKIQKEFEDKQRMSQNNKSNNCQDKRNIFVNKDSLETKNIDEILNDNNLIASLIQPINFFFDVSDSKKNRNDLDF
jgi:hypothetical protein